MTPAGKRRRFEAAAWGATFLFSQEKAITMVLI